LTFNQGVDGSIPSGLTNVFKALAWSALYACRLKPSKVMTV
jgi:hypothetical protein